MKLEASPLTRRDLLRLGAQGALTLGVAGLAASCSVGGGAKPSPTGSPSPLAPKAGNFVFGTWPGYISPGTIPAFEKAESETVSYKEVIDTYDSWFGVLRVPLSSSQPTGYDIVMLADWLVGKMARLGWLEQLDMGLIPNFAANAGPVAKNPAFDPNNAHSVEWLGGITAIGYNERLTGGPITSIDALFSDQYAGKVMMSQEMRETMGLTLLSLGIEPSTATVADAKKAQEKLLKQRDSGVLRSYTDFGNRLAALANGDAAVSMIVASDLFLAQQDHPYLQFAFPDEGAITWSDNLAIPVGAEHPTDAQLFMDFIYDPQNAAPLVEYYPGFTPVPSSQQVILDDASKATNPQKAALLKASAQSPLVFPGADELARLHPYNMLVDPAEEKAWNDLFQSVVIG